MFEVPTDDDGNPMHNRHLNMSGIVLMAGGNDLVTACAGNSMVGKEIAKRAAFPISCGGIDYRARF